MAPRPLAVALSALALLAPPAAAHTALEATSPRDGARLALPPREVRIDHAAPLLEVRSARVTVVGRDVAGAARLDPADRRRVIVPIRAPAAGVHAVAWVVVGADGHALAGRARFAVAPRGPVQGARLVARAAAAAGRALSAVHR